MADEPTIEDLIDALQRKGVHGGIRALAARQMLEEKWAELIALRAELNETVCRRCKKVYRMRLLNGSCPACAGPLASLLRAQYQASLAEQDRLRAKINRLEEVIIALSGDAYEGITRPT